jgi:hypothetical protein
MRIGEYRIVIQDMTGEVLATVDRTTATGHPAVGEEIVLDNLVYTVERVRHEDDPDARTTRRYTAPCLFVRRRDGVVRGRRKDAQRSGRVLPFAGPQRRNLDGLTSVILPPSLIAVLVAAGYDTQLRHFQRRSRGAVRLSRVGQGWFVEAGESPSDCLSLAREARKQRHRAEQLLCRLAACAPVGETHTHYVPHGEIEMRLYCDAGSADSTFAGADYESDYSTSDARDDEAAATSSASVASAESVPAAARSPPASS